MKKIKNPVTELDYLNNQMVDSYMREKYKPKDESKEVKEGGEDWEVKPFRTVTGLKYSIVSHYDVIAKCDKEDDAILLAQSKNMYYALKELVELNKWMGEYLTDAGKEKVKQAAEILLKATPKK